MATPDEFMRRGTEAAPPPGLVPALEALWWARKGNWDRAHKIVMAHEGETDTDWVHAYLHRVEGDIPNAEYWYRRAKKSAATGSLDVEWQGIFNVLLAASADSVSRGVKAQ